MKHLFDKYNRPTPRYTSYPPANFFSVDYTADQHLEAIRLSNGEGLRNLSFYIHIPFCPKLCHYCACNAYPMGRRPEVEAYMQALLREIDLVCEALDPNRPITQIHYGGGTPTAIPLDWLARINERLQSRFALAEGAEVAIECHPGYLSLGAWRELLRAGFNRVSLGVQDFNPEVLRAVNRQESREPFEDIFALLREHGVQINLDLIYGLPLQSEASFADNIRRAIALSPDRLVTFAYAHVPWVKEQQKVLQDLGLPTSEERAAMFAVAKRLLTEAGYSGVGMDHFVRPQDPLAIARDEGSLHRNFQGYCSRATTGQVYAFGVTAISQLTHSFAQNTKSIAAYIELLERGVLPVERGYALKSSEVLAGEIIAAIMCNAELRWADIAETIGCSPEELQGQVYQDEALLSSLVADGLVERSAEGLRLTGAGLPFVRIVASAFDPNMREGLGRQGTYSLAL